MRTLVKKAGFSGRDKSVIASNRILWDVITNPCLRYLPLAPKSPDVSYSKPLHCVNMHAHNFAVAVFIND